MLKIEINFVKHLEKKWVFFKHTSISAITVVIRLFISYKDLEKRYASLLKQFPLTGTTTIQKNNRYFLMNGTCILLHRCPWMVFFKTLICIKSPINLSILCLPEWICLYRSKRPHFNTTQFYNIFIMTMLSVNCLYGVYCLPSGALRATFDRVDRNKRVKRVNYN